jgi:two-component system, NtrC family, response regulator GlrR
VTKTKIYLQCISSEDERHLIVNALDAADIDIVGSEESLDEVIHLLAVGDGFSASMPLWPKPDLLINFSHHPLSLTDIDVLPWPGSVKACAQLLRNWFAPPRHHAAVGLNMIGSSESLQGLIAVINRVSNSDAPVLVQGETGTGKEVAARAIHYLSPREAGPFVPVNCGAYTDDLFIAELFGYERGAFTDAKKNHAGFIEQAEKGTLFLDEIDSLSPKAQVVLLRFLQDREYRPLGSSSYKRANVRIVAASNKSTKFLLSGEHFREDLFYRLDILSVNIPPLRQRSDDIPQLCQHFLKRFSQEYNRPNKVLSQGTLAWMSAYAWPGNIRELENYLHKLFVLTESTVIDVPDIKGLPGTDLTADVICEAPADLAEENMLDSFQQEKARVIEEFEKKYIRNLLQRCAGNVSKAARLAGKERRSFTRLIEKYGVDKNQYQAGRYPT